MKRKFIIILGLLTVLVQGCIVKSLHPFFERSDIVFKSELNGMWQDQDGKQWKIATVREEPNAYEITATKDGKQGVFIVHLFQVEGNLFLDFFPLSSDGQSVEIFDLHLLPTHSVAKVDQIEHDRISIKWFKEEWLADLFKQNRIKIAHERLLDEVNKDDYAYVLTASTNELRKFLLKYGNDESAFVGDNSVKLVLNRSL